MIVVITGDVIKSRKTVSKKWIEDLKEFLQLFGKNPNDWEIYRGDEFQIEIKNPQEALNVAIQIKAFLKSLKLDARMSLGLGEKSYKSQKITESNGTAFVNSGEMFENLKKQKVNLAVNTKNVAFDTTMNLMLKLSLSFMDNWLQQSAEFVVVAMQNPRLSQEEIGLKLGINQAAVSRRQKRAQYELVLQLDQYYRQNIKNIEA